MPAVESPRKSSHRTGWNTRVAAMAEASAGEAKAVVREGMVEAVGLYMELTEEEMEVAGVEAKVGVEGATSRSASPP